MAKKKIDPSMSDRLTAAIQLLAVVVSVAQLPNVSTPLLLGR
ncbi:hypothetical protein [Rhodococcus sp. Leaf278]|nr:hypothetical protein [Rhodococcus sp. Leaf278]